MRVIRLFGSVLTILTTGLLLASPGAAQPPSKLTDHITDTTGVLTDPGRATVSAAIDRLYRDRHIQLWVVYVDNFSRFKPDNWADKTRSASRLGGQDALLAIATNTKAYSFTVPPQVQGPTEAGLNNLRRNQIEPVLGAKDWSGAAVAAADGLDKSASSAKPASSSKPIWPLVAIGVIVAMVLLLLFVLYRARRRRRAPGSVAGHGDSLPQALSTADARLRQISDYVARHRDSVGADAQARLDEAQRHLAAARGKESTNDAEAIAHANRASTLAAQAQTLANADVLGRHGARRRRGR